MLSSLDVLYIVLAIGIALMSIFLSILLIYAIFILRDINRATDSIRDSAERVNAFIVKPLRMTHDLIKYARPVVDVVEQHFRREEEKPKKKKEKSK